LKAFDKACGRACRLRQESGYAYALARACGRVHAENFGVEGLITWHERFPCVAAKHEVADAPTHDLPIRGTHPVETLPDRFDCILDDDPSPALFDFIESAPISQQDGSTAHSCFEHDNGHRFVPRRDGQKRGGVKGHRFVIAIYRTKEPDAFCEIQ